jgi:hypothetical protein
VPSSGLAPALGESGDRPRIALLFGLDFGFDRPRIPFEGSDGND